MNDWNDWDATKTHKYQLEPSRYHRYHTTRPLIRMHPTFDAIGRRCEPVTAGMKLTNERNAFRSSGCRLESGVESGVAISLNHRFILKDHPLINNTHPLNRKCVQPTGEFNSCPPLSTCRENPDDLNITRSGQAIQDLRGLCVTTKPLISRWRIPGCTRSLKRNLFP